MRVIFALLVTSPCSVCSLELRVSHEHALLYKYQKVPLESYRYALNALVIPQAVTTNLSLSHFT